MLLNESCYVDNEVSGSWVLICTYFLISSFLGEGIILSGKAVSHANPSCSSPAQTSVYYLSDNPEWDPERCLLFIQCAQELISANSSSRCCPTLKSYVLENFRDCSNRERWTSHALWSGRRIPFSVYIYTLKMERISMHHS